jgi:hypothetical protein
MTTISCGWEKPLSPGSALNPYVRRGAVNVGNIGLIKLTQNH